MQRVLRAAAVMTIAMLLSCPARVALAQENIVHAVLFYRSTCSHCRELVNEVLPPIIEEFGTQLMIYYCDVSQPQGDALFTAAIDHFHISPVGTPTIIAGSEVLIGLEAIWQRLPIIIHAGLVQGGLDWPDIPGLLEALKAAQAGATPSVIPPAEMLPVFPTTTLVVESLPVGQGNSHSPVISQPWQVIAGRFMQDPSGNGLSIIILLGVIFALVYAVAAFVKQPGAPFSPTSIWIVPLLSVVGCAIAGYLAYVEITAANAICGPVGHCQIVQESSYARLFEVIPVGLLELTGYGIILIAWWLGHSKNVKMADLAKLFLFGLALVGTLFSIYLTFLEPFVIGASCAWCLASAVLMTVLMLLSRGPAKLAWCRTRQEIYSRS